MFVLQLMRKMLLWPNHFFLLQYLELALARIGTPPYSHHTILKYIHGLYRASVSSEIDSSIPRHQIGVVPKEMVHYLPGKVVCVGALCCRFACVS